MVVISYGFWQNRLGGDPNVIGQTLTLNEIACTVIGVQRPDFRHPQIVFDQVAELWRPFDVGALGSQRGSHYLSAIGRLKGGVSLEQAQVELTSIAQQLELAYPETNKDWGVTLIPLHKQVTGKVDFMLVILQCAVGFVLLIACVNVADLMLARVAARDKEIAVRTALGARRWQVVRLLLSESMLLALTGGALGFLLAWWGVDLLKSLAPADIPRLEDIHVDWRVLAFTSLLSLLTVLFFGLLPAWTATQTNLNEALKEGSHQVARGQGLRGALVIAEVALALVLLVGAGLLMRSLVRLQNVPLGYNPENLLTMRVSLPRSKARDDQLIINTFQQMLDRIERLPGVESAALTSSLPLGRMNYMSTGVTIVGQPQAESGNERLAGIRIITPGYLRLMGIPLASGREFSGGDTPTSSRVVLINETFARRYFPDVDPLGQKLVPGFGDGKTPLEVVGVVGDFKHESLERDTKPEIYVPQTQLAWSNGTLAIRTSVAPNTLATAVQQAVWDVERNAPVWRAATMREILSDTTAPQRFNTLLLGIFSVVAVILAAIGIYGVMAYTVAQRAREIGIRIALGAQAGDVLRLVLKQGTRLIVIGLVIGLTAAFALTRVMSSFLFGVSATDPLTFAAIAVLLTVIGLVACYVPARRAMKVDPMVALRYE